MKICHKCKIQKSLDAFYKASRGSCGRGAYCKPCQTELANRWRKNNPDKANATQRRWRRENKAIVKLWEQKNWLKRKYGMLEKDYQVLLEKQGGACAVCKVIPKQRLFVDHCHETKKVRGLLCSACNLGIGIFKNSPERLQAAAWYLLQ